MHTLLSEDRSVPIREALAWMDANAPVSAASRPPRVLVSDAMWVDLYHRGYAVDWYFKVDLDPEVKARYPRGWRDVSFVIFTNEMNEIAKSESRSDMTTLLAARDHGRVVANYGSGADRVWIYQVDTA
jgi:hypothetical protein